MQQLYQVIGTVVSLFQAVIIIYYFMNISIYDHSYISDNLNRDMFFRVSIALTIAIQYVLLVLYLWRFIKAEVGLAVTGIVFIVISESGWCLLSSVFTQPSHLIGFAIFVTGLCIAWMCILILNFIQFDHDIRIHILFTLAIVFGLVYSMFYAMYNEISWFYEHIGMIFFTLTNVYFFLHHDPNPKATVWVSEKLMPTCPYDRL